MPAQKVVIGDRGGEDNVLVWSDGLVTIPHDGHMNYTGLCHQIHHVMATAAVTSIVHLQTGTKVPSYHLRWAASVSGPGEFSVRESPTMGATGAEMDVICTQRAAPLEAETKAYYNSAHAGGVLLYAARVEAKGPFATPGTAESAGWHLAPASDYIFQFVGDGAAVVSWEILLCEHAN